MKRTTALFTLSACALAEIRAASETETRQAITALLAAPNYSWSRESEWTSWRDDQPVKGPLDAMSVTKGKSEKKGFTVATMEITLPGYLAAVPGPYHTVKGVFGGSKAVVDFGRGWMAAEELPAMFRPARGFSDKDENRGIMSVMLWAGSFLVSGEAMPSGLLRAILDECTGGFAVGSTCSLRLSAAGELQMLDLLRRHTTALISGPAKSVSRCSVRCWVNQGQLTKIELRVVGVVELDLSDLRILQPRTADRAELRNLDYTAVIVFSELGAAEISVPKEARDKLRESVAQRGEEAAPNQNDNQPVKRPVWVRRFAGGGPD